MTTLQPNRPVVRQTAAYDRADPIIVELHPRTVHIRVKGKRIGFDVPYDALLDLGRRLQFRRTQADRRAS